MNALDPRRVESLGPAERILDALLTFSDHMVHNRPGFVTPDPQAPHGVRWSPARLKKGEVFKLKKKGKKTLATLMGVVGTDCREVRRDGRVVGEYRAPGLFPEVAAWLYGRIAEVWTLDNEFAARWASWAFVQEHRDLKVALAAFMLAQSRCGEPVVEDGELLFHDEDFREIGEAMCLLRRRDKRDLTPRLLLRVGDLLRLPEVADINRRLGFGKSARNPPMGRWPKAVTRWLRHRERNPKMLQGLMRAGYRRTVMELARRVGYKPETPAFFATLRWKQKQAADGRRAVALGLEMHAERWEGLTEAEICQRIVHTRPSWKRIAGMLPAEIGLTRAILAAAVSAGCVSDAELVILTPTIEDLGLLDVPVVADAWLKACEAAEDQRAAHLATRVRGRETAERLRAAADRALQRSVEEATRGLRVYVAVDISGSMQKAIEKAKSYLAQFLQGFPLEKLTVAVFNTRGREVRIRHASARGVEAAFRGFRASGGTYHGAALQVFRAHPPAADEDALMLWVGDQQQYGTFTEAVRASGLNPVAFGFLYVPGNGGARNRAVEGTAEQLGIPCFKIDEGMFGDAYAVSRTLRHLIQATPSSSRRKAAARQKSLVETILETPLLAKPAWAA